MSDHVPAPYSAGTEPAMVKAPPNACDCHTHLFYTRVPSVPPSAARPEATVEDYKLLQKRIATSRSVVVTASNYGTNNQATTDAIAQMGASARGIAVVDTDITRAELKRLHQRGVRGIRITRSRVAALHEIGPLAKRLADIGWHIQLNLPIKAVLAAERLISELPTPVVFDHLARIDDVNDPALDVIKKLLERGRTWIKLSGFYLDSKVGAPTYADIVAVARVYAKAAPQRVVWGSDWPHVSARVKPDTARLFDLNQEWAPDAPTREMILVRNPETLYGFPQTA